MGLLVLLIILINDSSIKFDKKISAGETLNLLFAEHKKDILYIKLFDRLHNMQSIGAKSHEKIKKITEETIGTFTVLAAFLGIRSIEEELIQSCTTFTSAENSEDK